MVGKIFHGKSERTLAVEQACPPPASQWKTAQTFDSTAVPLSWEAEERGAAFGGFELRWRAAPGAWQEGGILTLPPQQPAVWFVGEPGGTYAFRLRAFDQNGQAEALPAEQAPEGVVAILRHGQPHASETDDSPAQARRLWLNEAASGNRCAAEDVDWSRFAVEQDGRDLLAAYSQSGGAAVRWR